MAEGNKFAELLRVEKVAIPLYSIFVKHWYVLHGGCSRERIYSLRYHNYYNHWSFDLKDFLLLACGASFAVVKITATVSGKRSKTYCSRNE